MLYLVLTGYIICDEVCKGNVPRAELLQRKPWMPGMSDIEQLSLIFQNLGTPTEASWPGARHLPNYVKFQKTVPRPLKTIFPKVVRSSRTLPVHDGLISVAVLADRTDIGSLEALLSEGIFLKEQ